MLKELVVATRNAGKLAEIRRLLEQRGVTVIGLEQFPDLPDIVEDGETFAANAVKKAETVARATGRPCLADDSGLAVEALGGQPGVRSARYAGSDADDAANNRKLLAEMRDIPGGERRAAFCCVMALALPGKPAQLFEGRVEGRILEVPQGDGGFGYDPLFLVESHGCSMAQLPMDVKNRISHRGQALQQLIDMLASSPD